MQASSKVQMKGPAARFSVLRPYPKIMALNHSFRRPPFGQNYLYVVDQDFGLRKYSVKVDSFQQVLKQAQWRYDCFAPIVRCLYVELLSPDYHREGEMDIYYSHMEVNLSEFKQLIVQEAIYLIMESLKGYQALLNKYRKVSVNGETIGVGSNGQTLVWINRFLEKSACEEQYMITSSEVITQILKLVKQRSEPVCSKLLTKIEEYIQKEKPSFKALLDYLKVFSAKNNIKVPQNLKYLLHQHRIKQSFNQLQSMRVSMKAINVNQKSVSSVFNINVKSPRCDTFNPSQVGDRPVSNDGGLLGVKRHMKTTRKYSAGQGQAMGLGLRQTIDTPISPMTPASPGAVSESAKKKISAQRKWSCWQNDNKFLGIQPKNRMPSFCEDKSLSGKSRAKTDNEGETTLPSFLKPLNKQNMKCSSGMSENTKAGNSPVKRSNHSQISDFSVDMETIKKIDRKSSIQLEELTFRDKVSGSQVPTLNKLTEHPLPRDKYDFEPTFNCIPQTINEDTVRETVIKGNDWTRTFKTLLQNKDVQLNVSLCDGKQEINNYLSDVKLDKLDSLSRQMVQSLMSEPSQHSIISNGSFEC